MNANDKEAVAIRYLFESSPDTTWDKRGIIQTLGLRGKQIKRMDDVLFRMVQAGDLVQNKKHGYLLAQQAALLTGTLRMVRNGAGHVIEGGTGKAIWIEPEDLGTALPGDTVALHLYRYGTESKGKVVKIAERSSRDVVGTL